MLVCILENWQTCLMFGNKKVLKTNLIFPLVSCSRECSEGIRCPPCLWSVCVSVCVRVCHRFRFCRLSHEPLQQLTRIFLCVFALVRGSFLSIIRSTADPRWPPQPPCWLLFFVFTYCHFLWMGCPHLSWIFANQYELHDKISTHLTAYFYSQRAHDDDGRRRTTTDVDGRRRRTNDYD